MLHESDNDVDWASVSILTILEMAIAHEIEARDYYHRAAECTGNPHTRDMLLRLSEMEQGHADTLQQELDELLIQRDLEAAIAD